MVSGDPAPSVTWERINGEVDDPEKYKTRYDERAREHYLEVRKEYSNKMHNLLYINNYFHTFKIRDILLCEIRTLFNCYY